MTVRPRTVVFDMDGTLLDTEAIAIRSWVAAFAEHGIEIDRTVALCTIGCDPPVARAAYRKLLGDAPDYLAIQVRCGEIFHQTAEREGIPLKRGARQILSLLRREGVRLGLATSTRRASAEPELLELGLHDLFEIRVYGDEVSERKPSPEIYLEAVRRLGLLPSPEIWAVEDSANGIRSAKTAGLSVAWVPDLQDMPPEIRALADITSPHLDQLASHFELA